MREGELGVIKIMLVSRLGPSSGVINFFGYDLPGLGAMITRSGKNESSSGASLGGSV